MHLSFSMYVVTNDYLISIFQSWKSFWIARKSIGKTKKKKWKNQVICAVQKNVPKKRKRGKKKELQQHFSDPFAKYAAELQVEFFTKSKLTSLYITSQVLTNL